MGKNAIETRGLCKRYVRNKEAVHDLNLAVPEGSVYVFLGRNGAGKTTTIRMLLGLLKKDRGDIGILSLNPDTDAVALKKRVGYVAENQKMYDWMTVGEIIGFCRPFYPSWDEKLEAHLLDRLELTKSQQLKNLSRGMYGKVALLLALCHNPELLILDDPTSGLDPVVRREFMEGIVDVIHEQKKTVFFSTHIVNEVEQVADHIGILEGGKLLLSLPLEELKNRVKKVRLVFESAVPATINVPGLLKKDVLGHECTITLTDYSQESAAALKQFGPKNIETFDMNLEDIFVALVGKRDPA